MSKWGWISKGKAHSEFTRGLRGLKSVCAKAPAAQETKIKSLFCTGLCQVPRWLLRCQCSFACSHGGGKHPPSRTHMQDVQLQSSETQKANRAAFLGAQVLPRVKA